MPLTRRQACLAALASLAPASSPVSARADQRLPFTLTDHRVAVVGRLNGRGPFKIVVDTGASAGIITRTLATTLAVPVIDRIQSPFGDIFDYARVTMSLGDALTLADQPVIILDTPNLLDDPQFEVLVSAGLLTAVDSVIDFDALTITRYPDSVPDRSGYIPVSSSFGRTDDVNAACPYGDVTIGPNTVHALWDTGSQTTMEISRAAADRLGLWDDTKPYAPNRYLHVGGEDSGISRVVRAGPISVGSITYDSALILLRADGQEDSVFGLSLIATLNILFEASARTLWVARNDQKSADIDYNLSGVSLTQGSGQLIVADVGTGSPAAAGGLRRGDILLIPATLDDADKLLDAPEGTGVGLTIERQSGPVLITFTLAPYL